MRRPAFRVRWSATVALLVVNVVAFIIQSAAYRFSTFRPTTWFALSVEGLRHGFVWQLLTYQFMHGGWLHLLLNCWAIYVFGREVEETLGRNSFLTLYFTSGVIGGLFQALAGVLLGGSFAAPVVGASAGAFGLVAAFATLYPERPLMLLLFFIIPLSMRAKFLLLFSAIITLFGLVFPMDNIAHAAHLGGMIDRPRVRALRHPLALAMAAPAASPAPAVAPVGQGPLPGIGAVGSKQRARGRGFAPRGIPQQSRRSHPGQDFGPGHPKPDRARAPDSRNRPREDGRAVTPGQFKESRGAAPGPILSFRQLGGLV